MDIKDFDDLKEVVTALRKVCKKKDYDIEITFWGTGGWSTSGIINDDGEWITTGHTKASRTANGMEIKITLTDSDKPRSIEEDDMNFPAEGRGATPMNWLILNLINSTQLALDWDENENEIEPPQK